MRPGDRKYDRIENVEREVLLARVLELPSREQLWIHHELGESIGGGLGAESKRARQARLRNEAIEAMRAAADYLQLPEGQAPSVNEFKKAAQETQLPMSFSTVYGAFEKRWEIASRFYEGKNVPPTAAQRSAQRAIKGRNRTNKEAPLTGLRLFLGQVPPPPSTRSTDYEEWAVEFNENLLPGAKRLVETAEQIRNVSRATWRDCLAVAQNEITLDEAQENCLENHLAESGPLIGHYLASRVLDRSPDARHATQRGYPEPVVCLGGRNWLWRLSDIRAFGEGKRHFTHEKGFLQEAYVDTGQVAARLGIGSPGLIRRLFIAKRTQIWMLVPRPTGRAGKRLYWERAAFERWLAKHPDAIGRKTGQRLKAGQAEPTRDASRQTSTTRRRTARACD